MLLFLMAYQNASIGYLSAALATVGSVAGTMILFYIGQKGGHKYLDKRTQTGHARRFRRWFHHYGMLTVFVPALIPAPLPLKIFVLSAGALGSNTAHFLIVIVVARILRYFGEAYLATRISIDPDRFLKQHMWQFLFAAIALFLVLLAIIKIKDRIRERAHHQAG